MEKFEKLTRLSKEVEPMLLSYVTMRLVLPMQACCCVALVPLAPGTWFPVQLAGFDQRLVPPFPVQVTSHWPKTVIATVLEVLPLKLMSPA